MTMQSKLIKHWQHKGFVVINLISITPIGLPDLICVKPDEVVFVESKELGDKTSSLQKCWLRRLTRLNFKCYVNFTLFTVKKNKSIKLF